MLNHIFIYVFVTSSNLILDYRAYGKLNFFLGILSLKLILLSNFSLTTLLNYHVFLKIKLLHFLSDKNLIKLKYRHK